MLILYRVSNWTIFWLHNDRKSFLSSFLPVTSSWMRTYTSCDDVTRWRQAAFAYAVNMSNALQTEKHLIKMGFRQEIVVSPCRVSRHCAASARLLRHYDSACFAHQVSLTKNERPKYAKLRFNACFLDNKSSFSFRYNKQLNAQLVGRHENLFNPENSYLPRATGMFWVEQIFMSPSKLGNKYI